MTHTYAILEVSPEVYKEIADKLRAADYHHAFSGDVIDLHGLAIQPEAPIITNLSLAERQWCILMGLTPEEDAPPLRRIAAFLRIYARRIRSNERWDTNETMAKAYESAARQLEQI